MRSFHTHSAPYKCATVSRTEQKLEVIFCVNCPLVSAEQASSVLRSAHKLYWNKKRSSSGVTMYFLRKFRVWRSLYQKFRATLLRAQMVGFTVGGEIALLHFVAIFGGGSGNYFAHFVEMAREFRLLAETHPQ